MSVRGLGGWEREPLVLHHLCLCADDRRDTRRHLVELRRDAPRRSGSRCAERHAMQAKNQRLTLLILAVAAVLGAVLLGMSALQDQAAYFYAPADVTRNGVPPDQAARLGGVVEEGSFRQAEAGVTNTL